MASEPNSLPSRPEAEPDFGDHDRRERILAVDAARGLALAGMVAYHVAWDIHALGLSQTDPSVAAAWRWFGHGIAATFLFLSGLSLNLASQAGRTGRQHAARLAVVALTAGGITLATRAVFPATPIRFGILHCLVVTNVIALLLRRFSNRMLVLVGAVSLVVPGLWPWPLGVNWAGLGLSVAPPPALDFRPILPWLAPVLFGVAAGRTALPRRLRQLSLRNTVAGAAAVAGRHSLVIYLVHQPILLGGLWLGIVASGISVEPVSLAPAEASAFLKACRRECIGAGGDDTVCEATCHCVLTGSHGSRGGIAGLLAWLRPTDAALRTAIAACAPTRVQQR